MKPTGETPGAKAQSSTAARGPAEARPFQSGSELKRELMLTETSYSVLGARYQVLASVYLTFARYWCTICTVMDPSPTADATRLMEEWRVSPAANTPGMMLSKINGSRSSFQPLGRSPSLGRSAPVSR